jgi:YihY family inner membrane protein
LNKEEPGLSVADKAEIPAMQRTFTPSNSASMAKRLSYKIVQACVMHKKAFDKFWQIDGGQWAGAFAFNTFFSLFPLIVLFVTIASSFIDRAKAGTEIIYYVEKYFPLSGDMQHYIFDTLSGVVTASAQASWVALVLLVWVAIQCFTTLISAINRAWNTEHYNWWQMPIKSFVLFGIMTFAVLLGMTIPLLAEVAKNWFFFVHDFSTWVYGRMLVVIPLITVFISLSLLYKFSPQRLTRFNEVWAGAFTATMLLWLAESLFVTLNAVYGAFGGIMALLLWIYVSGGVFIYGACLCAVRSEAT